MKCIEKKIINYLSNLGISIHIYHAFSTNSIYIKLDYGVLGSIRISDHDGKERYKYKYNVRTDIKEYYEENNRKYYPSNKIENLICDILLEHNEKLHDRDYNKIKERYKNNKKDVSFWKQCKAIVD